MADTIFTGDDVYCIDATGDVVTGDEVRFTRAVFGGSHRRPKFLGYDTLDAVVVRDSYGAEKQQHTFTLDLGGGTLIRIKGRNLYGQSVWRKPWADEAARRKAADEKHVRGDAAREARRMRKEAC